MYKATEVDGTVLIDFNFLLDKCINNRITFDDSIYINSTSNGCISPYVAGSWNITVITSFIFNLLVN